MGHLPGDKGNGFFQHFFIVRFMGKDIGFGIEAEQLPIVIDAWEALNMAQMEYLEKMGAYYKMIVSYEKEIEK